jgi:transposase InsO family protein
VRTLCRLLNVSKSGFYQFVANILNQSKCDNEKLVSQIKGIQEENYYSYGYRRIHIKLKYDGLRCSKKKVQKLMKIYQLSPKRKKKFTITTNSQHNRTIAPNLLNRQFKTSSPNTHWVSDLTYVRTKAGWAYLAVVIDLYSRAVVGWSIDRQMPAFLVLDALNTAIEKRNPQDGLLFHSDRGIQYASDIFQRVLHIHGIKSSMSRKGDCWDNAVAESFFKTIKSELNLEKNNLCFEETKANISKYIDEFYNQSRLHSYTGYKPPFLFEKVAGFPE